MTDSIEEVAGKEVAGENATGGPHAERIAGAGHARPGFVLAYRPEIDGLRALAVLPVILFHAGLAGMDGGYVGVDVFFVISGFLISTIIMRELDRGSFSLVNFYERRARRILPALFAVILVCLPFAWLWLGPADLSSFGGSLVAVMLFVSNVFFWQESGYFSQAAELKPLLHTWSLAVEEQYYLIFPLILMAMWKGMRALVVPTLVMAFVVSLGLSHWAATASPSANFFLLPTRAWELLIGVIATLWLSCFGHAGSLALNNAMSALGVALIVVSILAFDAQTPFPGLWALVPTVGTALVIVCAVEGTLAHRVLSVRVLVGVGLVSYSAYLWHQPLLAFARHRAVGSGGGEPAHGIMWGLSAASVVLAWASWKWVESPFRDKARTSRTQIFTLSLAGLVVLGGVGAALVLSNGAEGRFTANERRVLANFRGAGDYTAARMTALELAPFDAAKPHRVLIIGDSYAQDLTNAVYERGLDAAVSFSAFYIHNRCGVLLVDAARLREHRDGACAGANPLETRPELELRLREADEVWVASAWREWNLPFLTETLEALQARNPELVVFGRKGFGDVREGQLIFGGLDAWRHPRPVAEEVFAVNAALQERLPDGVRFVDVQTALCGVGESCVNWSDGDILSYDGGHLTRNGARVLGKRVFSDEGRVRVGG